MADPGSGSSPAQAASAAAGPVGSGAYVVKPGDGMESIAYAHGFFYETLWNDPQNAKLKEVRKDPNVLLPGDRVHIMEKRRKEVTKDPEQVHRFRRKGVPHEFKMRFSNWRDEPYANLKAQINVDGTLSEGTTDGDGVLTIPISPGARTAKIKFENGYEYTVALGHLDPVTEIRGVQQRLRNLGFYHGPVSGVSGEETAQAVRDFQTAHGLTPSGQADQDTQSLLVEVNGS